MTDPIELNLSEEALSSAGRALSSGFLAGITDGADSVIKSIIGKAGAAALTGSGGSGRQGTKDPKDPKDPKDAKGTEGTGIGPEQRKNESTADYFSRQEQWSKDLTSAVKKMGGADFADGIKSLGDFFQNVGEDSRGDSETTGDAGLRIVGSALDIPLESLKEMKETWDRFSAHVKDDSLVKMGIDLFKESVLRAGMKRTTGILNSLKNTVERDVTSVNKAALNLSMPFMQSADTQAFASVTASLDTYRTLMMDAVKQTGIGRGQFDLLAASFRDAGIDYTTFDKTLSSGTSMAEGNVTGLADAMYVLQGTGLSLSTGADALAFSMRNLGANLKTAQEDLGQMAALAAKTGEPFTKVFEAVNSGRQALKYYGDTTAGVTKVYENLLKTVGKGKEQFAADFLGVIVSGVSKMNSGLAAFIGQASGIGKGGGALSSSLEVEEKIASGDIQGVMNEVVKQIEMISGSALMTRKDALDSGKGEQFFLQRELLKSFGFDAGGSEATTRLLENLAKGQGDLSGDVTAAFKGTEMLRERGRGRTQGEEGAIGRAANVADAYTDLELTRDSSHALLDASGQFEKGVSLFDLAAQKLSDAVSKSENSASDAKKVIDAATDKGGPDASAGLAHGAASRAEATQAGAVGASAKAREEDNAIDAANTVLGQDAKNRADVVNSTELENAVINGAGGALSQAAQNAAETNTMVIDTLNKLLTAMGERDKEAQAITLHVTVDPGAIEKIAWNVVKEHDRNMV